MKGEEPVDDIISYIVKMALPALFGALLWAVSRPWRRACLEKKDQTGGPYREGAVLLFFMFLAGLLALTLTVFGMRSSPAKAPSFRGRSREGSI